MSAETESWSKMQELMESQRQIDMEIGKAKETLEGLYIAFAAVERQIQQLRREMR